MIVLLRWPVRSDANPDDVEVDSIHEDLNALRDRLELITKRNQPYKMRQITSSLWEIGPEHDEGFFGNKPMRFAAVQPKWPKITTT